jgi:hypothetical protein
MASIYEKPPHFVLEKTWDEKTRLPETYKLQGTCLRCIFVRAGHSTLSYVQSYQVFFPPSAEIILPCRRNHGVERLWPLPWAVT